MEYCYEDMWRNYCPPEQVFLWERAMPLIANLHDQGYLVSARLSFEDNQGHYRLCMCSDTDGEFKAFNCVELEEEGHGEHPYWAMELVLRPGLPFEAFSNLLEAFPQAYFHVPGMVVRGGFCFDYIEQSHLELTVMMEPHH